MKIKNLLLLLPILLTLLFSCGRSDKEKISDAIKYANQKLSAKDCDAALTLLNEVGYQHTNSRWLQTYSSAYACKANFSEVTFFGKDLDNLENLSSGLLSVFTTFSTSVMTSSNDASFNYLQTAIDTLLYAGNNTASSHVNRATAFNSSEANNLSVQALYMLFAQMGKYFYLYGNVDSNGLKGGGSAGNNCLADYTHVDAQAARATATGAGSIGACISDNNGHTDLNADKPATMCKGIILFNNFLDILLNVAFSGANSGAISTITPLISSLCSAAGLTTVCDERDLATCTTNATSNIREYELFFIAMFETMVI